MKRKRYDRAPLLTALTLSALAACSGQDVVSLELGSTGIVEEGSGSVTLALTSGSIALSSVEFSVKNSSNQTVLQQALDVSSPSTMVVLEFDAPAGAGYVITLSATGGAGVTCTGSAEFDVAADATTEVPVALRCEAAGGVRVVGSLTPPSSCPEVELAPLAAPLHVGDEVQLEASPASGDGLSYAWASSGGALTDSRNSAATFRCTEAGPVTLTLTVSQGECTDVASVEIACEAERADSCSGLGESCHVVDPGSGLLHECHELGHDGSDAECSAGRAACVQACGEALCQTLGSLCHDVDPGSGPLHECHELGHSGDATACFEGGRACFDLCTAARNEQLEAVTLNFAAEVNGAAFECGTSYDAAGTPAVTVEPRDFRFFVSDVRLLTAEGGEEPVQIEDRAPAQSSGVALLDFADTSGLCASGTAATNTTVTGRVFPGEYVGVAFNLGVPEALNHDDPATLAAPLESGAMSWGWLLGYKFLVAELAQVSADAGAGGLGLLHLGSTACTGNPGAGTVVCEKPNRSEVRLNDFSAATNTIVADIGALFASTDLTGDALCHSSGASCAGPFASVGLDLDTGLSLEAQTLFHVE